MLLVTFLKCHSLSLPSRTPSSLIRGRFGVVMDVFGGYYYFSALWTFFSISWAMFFKSLRCLINSESRFSSPHHPHHIKEAAGAFLFYSSPAAHISSCHTKHQRQGKRGGEGGEWIYSTCLSPQVGYARRAHWNVTQHRTEVKHFNRW